MLALATVLHGDRLCLPLLVGLHPQLLHSISLAVGCFRNTLV